MESERGAAESIFADWMRRREAGRGEELEALLDEHPAARADLLHLHRAWVVLSQAIADQSRGASPSATTTTTDRIGPYRKIELLGRGGQGEVWLAEDSRLRRRVALKILRAVEPERLKRFEREAAVTSRLDHPAICPVYESGEIDGIYYIAMRFVEGRSLAARVAEALPRWMERGGKATGSSSGPSDAPEIAGFVRIVSGAARALHAAHEAGVIHRDVKPANILITRDDQPVVVDFGFAEDTEGGWSELTRSREFLGTPAYMSPEQLLGKRASLDARTDVWSLGVTLYECLTGTRPFDGPTWQAVFHAITNAEVPAGRAVNRSLSTDLEVILATALAKDRERRYASARAFAEDLDAWLEGRPIAARPISSLGKLARWARREPALAGLACTLAVLLPLFGGLGAYALLTREDVLAAERAGREQQLEEQLMYGYSRLADSDWQGAFDSLEGVLRAEPVSVEAAFGAFLALYQIDTPGSFAFLRDRFPPVDADSFSGRIRAQLLDQGLLPGTRAAWMEALPAPRDAGEHFFAAWLWLDLERGEQSWSDAERARILGGENERTRCLESARGHLYCALLLSGSPRLLHLTALAYVLSHLGAPASELLAIHQVVTTRWPAATEAAVEVAEALRYSSPARALELLDIEREKHPDLPMLHRSIGLTARALGDEALAETSFRRAVELEPGSASNHYDLAVALLARHDHEGAIASDREAVRLRPTLASAWADLSLGLYASGDLESASDAAKRALNLAPERASVWMQAARCQARLGDLERAREQARHAHEIASSDAGAIARAAALVSELDTLAEHARRLGEWLDDGSIEPEPAERAVLASAAFQLGRYEEAAGLFADLAAESPEVVATCRASAAAAAAWAALRCDAEQTHLWRDRALTWLEDELAHTVSPEKKETRRAACLSWKSEADLAPAREARWRADFDSNEERRAAAIWRRIDEILAER